VGGTVGGTALADPIFPEPVAGKGRLGDDGEAAGQVGLVAEMRALGVLTVDRLASWPAQRLGLEAQVPALVAARAGLIAGLTDTPVTFVARVDISDAARPYVPDGIGRIAGGIVDDLYLAWRPSPVIELVMGRARVPWSRPRQYEELDEPLGAPPFITDRIAPDRRYGALLTGDLGAVAYAAGAWEDVDALEPRLRVGDPSANGAFIGGGWIEWTPRAPMYGSNPVGKIVGARGPLPTPRTDPWFETWRWSLGGGAISRIRSDGSLRLDAAASGLVKWTFLAASGEVIYSRESTRVALGGHLELMTTPLDRIALSIRGEVDNDAPNGGEMSASAAFQYHVTKDRRNRIGLIGWVRRDKARDTPYDGLVVFLQASI